MDDELKVIRACCTGIDSLDSTEQQARVAAYIFDRYVPQGMQSRALVLALEQVRGAQVIDDARREVAASLVDAAAATVIETADQGNFTKVSRTIVEGSARRKVHHWVCKVCDGKSPERTWAPSVLEVEHDSSCSLDIGPDENGEIQV